MDTHGTGAQLATQVFTCSNLLEITVANLEVFALVNHEMHKTPNIPISTFIGLSMCSDFVLTLPRTLAQNKLFSRRGQEVV